MDERLQLAVGPRDGHGGVRVAAEVPWAAGLRGEALEVHKAVGLREGGLEVQEAAGLWGDPPDDSKTATWCSIQGRCRTMG